MTAVRLTVLGSGTLLPSTAHHSSAYLLETGHARCLLDCGAGTVHGFDRYGVEWRTLDVVAFSHFHTDHLGDLPALLFALKHGVRPERTRPLTLVGPPGLRARLDGLAAAFGDYVLDPGFPLRIEELGRDGCMEPVLADGGGVPALRLELHPTPHTERSVAQRWSVGDRVVAYTGDTGPPDEELTRFLSGADVLVAEASLPDSSEVKNHLTPGGVAALAAAARPRLLVTTHVYPPLEPGRVPSLVAEAGYGGRVEAARDGLVIEIGAEVTTHLPR